MQEHGKVIAVLNPQTGTSPRTGQPWYSQSYVLEIDGRYTRRVAFSLWGLEPNERAALQVGQIIDVFAEVEAHEFQGRWYNEIRAYDIHKNGQSVLRPSYPAYNAQPAVAQAGARPAVQSSQPAYYQGAAPTAGAPQQYPTPGVPPVVYPSNDYPAAPAPGVPGAAPY